MSRRLRVLAPACAVLALAVVPAAAHAEPHWYQNNLPVGSTPVVVSTAGNLTINALGATIKCAVADTEEIWNPAGGGAGLDLMTGFVTGPCKVKVPSPGCPKGPIPVSAEGLPWPSRLFSESTTVIRDEIVKIRLNIGCANSAGTVGDVFEGALTPQVVNNALQFGGPGGGTLYDSSANPLTVTGKDKLFTSPKTKINAKDP